MALTISLSVITLLVAPALAIAADCSCGYRVNTTTFTEIWETDFLHTSNVTYANIGQSGWAPQVYNVTSGVSAAGPFGKMMLEENIVANPLRNEWDWGGDGILGGDPGLQLWVREALVDQMVPGAELGPARMDMLFGSFRAGIKFTGISGTCGAFFWFRNDSQEIDAEYLSRNSSYLNLLVQPPLAEQANYTARLNSTTFDYGLPYNLDEEYHEIRFDWFPDRVDFYTDGTHTLSITEDVPDSPGRIMLNHWSNGNTGWSGGPPTQDAVMTVSYVKAYFNVSGSDATTASNCGNLPLDGRVCKIPTQTIAPDPTGPNGNTTGRTTFLDAGRAASSASPAPSTTPVSSALRSAHWALQWSVPELAAFYVCKGLWHKWGF